MIEAGTPSTCRELDQCFPKRCARPTGVVMVRTTRGPAQRGGGAELRAARKEVEKRVAKGSIKAGARKPRPGCCKGPAGTEGGKPRPEYSDYRP